MRVRLEYGRDGLEVELPDQHVVRTLAYKAAAPLIDPAQQLNSVLDHPCGASPLVQLADGRRSACILVCDFTRPVPNHLILPAVLERLENSGIAPAEITILVATGLHRGSTPQELLEMLGPGIVANYRIENHDGRDQAAHRYLGDSPRGVPIWIDRRYLQADLKIATGLIEPHLMAGFSGGRKLVCPGVAGIETIRAWHSPRFLEHPLADCGVLEGNPVHEENTWIARRAGCDFIVNAVIDDRRRPLYWVAGDMEKAFLEGVEFVRSVVTDAAEPVDIVVTTAAGYPLDATFYQSVKGLCAALPVVKTGGVIILAARMQEGIGSPEFRELFARHADVESFMRAIQNPQYFQLDQWQLEKMAHVLRKARVVVVTDGLSAETLRSLYVESAASVEEAVRGELHRYGHQATIAVIPKGPYVLAQTA